MGLERSKFVQFHCCAWFSMMEDSLYTSHQKNSFTKPYKLSIPCPVFQPLDNSASSSGHGSVMSVCLARTAGTDTVLIPKSDQTAFPEVSAVA